VRATRIIMLVLGVLVGFVAVGLGIAGGVAVLVHATQRDADGFYATSPHRYETVTVAITSREIDLGAAPGREGWRPLRRDWLTARLQVSSARPVFVGIGPQARVEAYLSGVAHDEVDEIDVRPFSVTYERRPGDDDLPGLPAEQDFWVAESVGSGFQELRWDVEPGRWAVVVMNADGEPGVSVQLSVGVRTGLLLPIGLGLLVAMLVTLALAVALVVLAVRERGAAAPHEVPEPVTPVPEVAYPVRLDGALQPDLNRWLWLVKWFLAIPHLLVLVFLWMAFFLLTIAAGISIAFTGRYPRGIFDFNVGVIRWTWRVTFYAFTLATDRYPPFTIEHDPTYPATFEVDHPEELSRGLVWVKWWLLAIPHYLIVGLFGGGFTWFSWQTVGDSGTRAVFGGGLIGLLVLFAAVALLFTARYPRSIFDTVMGLHRWVHRVVVYAALMRDEYPPFRLDTGGRDPASEIHPPTVDASDPD
jgi:hypothetical protein